MIAECCSKVLRAEGLPVHLGVCIVGAAPGTYRVCRQHYCLNICLHADLIGWCKSGRLLCRVLDPQIVHMLSVHSCFLVLWLTTCSSLIMSLRAPCSFCNGSVSSLQEMVHLIACTQSGP